jgi:hemerythrin superfamily protein
MLIFEELINDHQLIRSVLKELEATNSRNLKKRTLLLENLRALLTAHTRAEEIALYRLVLSYESAPGALSQKTPLKTSQKTAKITLEAIEEHRIVESALEDLQELNPALDKWSIGFWILRENLEHHMSREERELFVDAKEIISEDDAEEMADLFHEIRFSNLMKRREHAKMILAHGGVR